ncbi:MAG: hypothetical protein ACRCVI_01750 [Mycoplasmoidaceae bacterium]
MALYGFPITILAFFIFPNIFPGRPNPFYDFLRIYYENMYIFYFKSDPKILVKDECFKFYDLIEHFNEIELKEKDLIKGRKCRWTRSQLNTISFVIPLIIKLMSQFTYVISIVLSFVNVGLFSQAPS